MNNYVQWYMALIRSSEMFWIIFWNESLTLNLINAVGRLEGSERLIELESLKMHYPVERGDYYRYYVIGMEITVTIPLGLFVTLNIVVDGVS